MSVEPMDLELFAAWVSRPGATPAPHTDPDPTGLRFDRTDVEDEPTGTPLPDGVDGWVPAKACGHIVGDRCTCVCQDTADRIELAAAPVLDAFDLAALRAAHITAAEWDRRAA